VNKRIKEKKIYIGGLVRHRGQIYIGGLVGKRDREA
jgi:hypothetical protein